MLNLIKKSSLIVLVLISSVFYSLSASADIVGGVSRPYTPPAIRGVSTWLNSEPLKLKDLTGKVVLVDVWSRTCPHCMSALPHVVKWANKYSNQGLVVIGIHVPLQGQRSDSAVKEVLQEYGVNYPIALDNNLATSDAFGVSELPAFFLINKEGKVVYKTVGDNYSTIEKNIKELLKQ